jgi:hypothetical protein
LEALRLPLAHDSTARNLLVVQRQRPRSRGVLLFDFSEFPNGKLQQELFKN